MDHLYKLRDMCNKELAEITEKGELTAETLAMAHTLTSTIKNTYRIEMYDKYGEDEDDEYDGRWEARGDYGPRGGHTGYRRDRQRR
jgi:hypothetical protein